MLLILLNSNRMFNITENGTCKPYSNCNSVNFTLVSVVKGNFVFWFGAQI